METPDVPWLRRIFWVAVIGFAILIGLTSAQAITQVSLRYKLNDRDAAWQKRLDALDSEVQVLNKNVQLLQKAKLAQDQFNDMTIRLIERMQKTKVK